MLYSAARLLARQPQLCRFSTTRTLRQLVVEEASVTTPAATIPAATTPAATIPAPAATPLPYFIHRSKSNNLPIYEEGKNGGNLLQTRIRKVEGNVEALRLDIIAHLGIAPEKVHINNLTKHVVIKGHWRKKVEKVLTELKF